MADLNMDQMIIERVNWELTRMIKLNRESMTIEGTLPEALRADLMDKQGYIVTINHGGTEPPSFTIKRPWMPPNGN